MSSTAGQRTLILSSSKFAEIAPWILRWILVSVRRIAVLTLKTLAVILGSVAVLIGVLLIALVVDQALKERKKVVPKPPAFPENWVADYEAMRDYIADNYANLEWSITEGRIDPYRLNVQTLAAIRAAHTDWEARHALVNFVKAFHDSHLWLPKAGPPAHWYDRAIEWVNRPRPTTSPKTACRMLGYSTARLSPGFEEPLALERFHAFQKLSDSPNFPAGVITLG